MSTPLISVIMPVKNAEAFLKKAIKSILAQSYKQFEFVIIDDDSHDDTKRILKIFTDKRIKTYRNHKSLGVAQTLNRALKLARGDYIARMDADDIALPQRLKSQIEWLQENSTTTIVGSWVELIDLKGNPIRIKKVPKTDAQIKRQLLLRNPMIHPTIMINRKHTRDLHYEPDLNGAEDYALYLKLGLQHAFYNLPTTLLKFRVHPGSVTFTKLKHIQRQTIKVQIRAFTTYGYPIYKLPYLLYSMSSSLIPTNIKKLLYNRLNLK